MLSRLQSLKNSLLAKVYWFRAPAIYRYVSTHKIFDGLVFKDYGVLPPDANGLMQFYLNVSVPGQGEDCGIQAGWVFKPTLFVNALNNEEVRQGLLSMILFTILGDKVLNSVPAQAAEPAESSGYAPPEDGVPPQKVH